MLDEVRISVDPESDKGIGKGGPADRAIGLIRLPIALDISVLPSLPELLGVDMAGTRRSKNSLERAL